MQIHCRDCWDVKEQHEEATTDLCQGCWNARMALLEARKTGRCSQAQFTYAIHGESRATRIEKILAEIRSINA